METLSQPQHPHAFERPEVEGGLRLSASGPDVVDVGYLREKQLGRLADEMIRGMLLQSPRPVNPGEWILDFLKAKLPSGLEPREEGTPPATPAEEKVVTMFAKLGSQSEETETPSLHPAKLWVSVEREPSFDGMYKELGVHNSQPYWGCLGKRLYSTTSGWWLLTDNEDSMSLDKGLLSSYKAHGGVMPHEMELWEIMDTGSWRPAKVKVTDSLLVDKPVDSPKKASSGESKQSPCPESPCFSPGEWDSPRGLRPPGAGSGFFFLPRAVTNKPIRRVCTDFFVAGHVGMQGWRTEMEDSYSMTETGFFLICDGHGGQEVALRVAEELTTDVTSKLRRLSDGDPSASIPEEDLTAAAKSLDDKIIFSTASGGCTATFATVRPVDTFYKDPNEPAMFNVQIGNIGDSRTVIYSRKMKKVIFETRDHKPSEPSESQRLKDSGYETGTRIDGSLGVSRAFGDKEEKSKGLIVDPEVTNLELQEGDALLLGCDGVFDFMSSEEAAAMMVDMLDSTNNDPAAAAAAICDEALRRGTTDNISCIVVFLSDGSLPGTSDLPAIECVPGPYSAAWNNQFRDGYERAAQEGGMTLGQALERRYRDVCIQLKRIDEGGEAEASADTIALRDEFALFHHDSDAIEALRTCSGVARMQWFQQWSESEPVVSPM